MFKDVKRVIFDLDGTLIKHNFDLECQLISKHCKMEGNDEFKRQLDIMFKENGKYLKGKKITKEYFGYVIEELMPILKTINLTGCDLLSLIDKCHSGTLMEGAKETLEYLTAKNYQIVALTNWFYDYQLGVLKRLGINEYFERIYAYDNFYAKPNKYAMLRALEGIDKSEVIVIGDDVISDVAAAKKLGINVIGFNVDYSKYPGYVKADIDIANLTQIKNYL